MAIKYQKPNEYFNRFAPNYDATVLAPDYNYTGVDQVFNTASGFLTENPKAVVLDVGCGTGLVGEKLKNEFPDITLLGIDISSKMLDKAKQKGIYSKLESVNLECDEFTFNPDSIDLVVSSATFDYVRKLSPSFKEISRVLRQDGELCVTTYAGEDEQNKFLRRLAEADAEITNYTRHDIRDFERSPFEITALFGSHGIKAKLIKTFDAFRSFEGGHKGTQYHLFTGVKL